MKRIELLAPAKDGACGRAAMTCGADAVYIGAARFGAREAAGNQIEEIAGLVEYAHKYWASVYVTLNTVLRDEEFPEALRLIRQLYEIGVDGLIIQDVGLLECDLPPLPLIASTQMHNVTPAKVAFLEHAGFQRVILARELSLEQIRAIRAETTIELECFVHGALCVGYSGQCYLSYALGGRSGNRGQCAQPCRRRYALKDRDGNVISDRRYLLSLKDLDRSDYLRELLEAGITAFKIEGRLKDQAYVMNVVSYYRRKLDAVLPAMGLSKSSSGDSSLDFTPNPLKTFNRGYTAYFLTGRGRDLAALDTPKSVGEPLGAIRSVSQNAFTLAAPCQLHSGDGVCFFDRDQVLQGTVVNQVDGQTVSPNDMAALEPGTRIYRNYDHAFQAQLHKSRAKRTIAVTFALKETPDGFMLSVSDEDGNAAAQTLNCEKILARNPDTVLASVHKQLAKCGETEFTCKAVQVDWAAPYFLPVAVLNELRRNVLDTLAAARLRQRPVFTEMLRKNAAPYPEQRLSYRGNVLNAYAAAFYRRHGITEIQPAAESGLDLRGQNVMTTKYCLKYQLGFCHKEDGAKTLREPLALVDEDGRSYPLRFDCAACEMEVFL